MKLGIISDLHLDKYKIIDVYDIVGSIVEQCLKANIDYLMIAGDISDGLFGFARDILYTQLRMAEIRWFEVVGNHDNLRSFMLDERSRHTIGDHRLTMATLWTDCHNDWLTELWYRKNMPEAQYETGITEFSVATMKFVHECQKKYIFEMPADVVMTHNPPSMRSVGSKFIGQDTANQAFIPDLEEQVYYFGAKLWICGHVHNKHEYEIGGTKIVCNPLGYQREIYRNPLDYKIQVEEI